MKTNAEVKAKVRAKYIVPLDPVELAVRLVEAHQVLKRPPGSTGAEAFFSMPKEAQDAWLRAANAALNYWQESITGMNASN